MIDNGDTEIGGSFPVNCSGGVLEQPHRRLRPAPLRRGRQPGAGSGRRHAGRRAKVALAMPTAPTASTQHVGRGSASTLRLDTHPVHGADGEIG